MVTFQKLSKRGLAMLLVPHHVLEHDADLCVRRRER